MSTAIDIAGPSFARSPSAATILARLGVPSDAAKVLIFGETSHWDPNWLRTADEYFEGQVVPVIRAVVSELTADPKRVFAFESTFFLERFWNAHPEHRDEIHALLQSRRLRLTGTGITTPDTVIPNPEAILRDYLLGQQWLRSIGVDDEPRVAYLPDDFGYAPSLPSLLAELGYSQAVITRVDGAHFIGADYRPTTAFPLPGSSADLLQNRLTSADFVWAAPDGREVLCHWNPFTYFQGDMLAYVGVIRWMGNTYGMSWRTGRHIARRVASYVDALSSLARTPYLFCPIGCDFNPPIPNLGFLLDRYNREVYPQTGVWLVSAGLDDYMDLVDTERGVLPRLELDVNPYWMGFYASRPEAKVRHHRVTRKLLAAEAEDAERRMTGEPACPRIDALKTRLWNDLAFANHHDFITGTSPDRVWLGEQAPLLRDAETSVDRWLAERPHRLAEPSARLARAPAGKLRLRRAGHVLTIEAPHGRLVFDEERGGCLVSWRTPDGTEHVRGPSLDLGLYRDTGGLWRLGHEFAGGRFGLLERGESRAVSVRATVMPGSVHLVHRDRFGGRTVERGVWVFADRPEIVVEVTGGLPLGTSMCVELETGLHAHQIDMDVPGGIVRRPWRKLYDPTFWPAFSFAHVCDETRGLAMFLAGPASVSATPSGRFTAMVQRNAPKEVAYGILPVLAHPARGTDPGFRVTCAVVPTDGPLSAPIGLARRAHDVLRDLALHGIGAGIERPLAETLVVDGDAFITALKPADRGPGYIVRLMGQPGAQVSLHGRRVTVKAAARCDARERDRHPLAVDNGHVALAMDGQTVSVRLELADDSAGGR